MTTAPTVDKPKRVWYGGVRMDTLMRRSLRAVEDELKYTLTYTQGSYNAGVVPQSGGTHDGGGAVDISIAGMSNAKIKKVVKTLRKYGWAAWDRATLPGYWSRHIHAIMLGHPRLSPSAAAQERSYRSGWDGLANPSRDKGWRPKKIQTFREMEANMKLSKAQENRIAKKVANRLLNKKLKNKNKPGKKLKLRHMWRNTHKAAIDAAKRSK